MPIGRNRVERDALTSKLAKLYGETGRFAIGSGSHPCFGLISISLESAPPKRSFAYPIPNDKSYERNRVTRNSKLLAMASKLLAMASQV